MKPRISRPFASVPITRGASNPSRSRNRRSACTDGVHGPARRCTVSPIRTASFRFPPRDRSSAIAREGTRAQSRVRLRCVLAVAPADFAKLPATPGVYLLVDARGRLLYIGRASSLRSRVRSYWSVGLDRPGLGRMVRRVRRVLAGSCVSEHEAALLGRTLLERLDPPFNRPSGVGPAAELGLCRRASGLRRQVDGLLWITQRQNFMRLGESGERWIVDESRIDEVVSAIG